MEKQTAPVISSAWLSSYWQQNPRNKDEDPLQYNRRLMQQVIELLEGDAVKLSPEY
jgi:hypothetical protein